MNRDNEQLFKLIFKNKILFKELYRHVKLFKKNESVCFIARNHLISYQERNYINEIIYTSGEKLIKGDLPEWGVLKIVRFSRGKLSEIEFDVIPNGVEILEYGYIEFGVDSETPLSTLPSSIHTVKNIAIYKSSTNSIIPPNITSISFNACISISPPLSNSDDNNNNNENGFILIPNTIKKLKFNSRDWNNNGIKILKGDIPNSVSSLSIIGYHQQIDNLLKERVLQNNIKKLEISMFDIGIGSFDYLPPNIESLILYIKNDLTNESNLNKFTTIKKLQIINMGKGSITVNSLPPSIIKLKLLSMYNQIQPNTIPNSVKDLELRFNYQKIPPGSIPNNLITLSLDMIIDEPNVLPTTLVNLNYRYGNSNVCNFKQDFTKMFQFFPKSLRSINIPKISSKLLVNIPNNLNVTYR